MVTLTADEIELVYNTSLAATEAVYETRVMELELAIEVVWVLLGAILVFLMQAGFTLLEVGSVSSKNTLNILTKNIVDATMGAAVWYAWGNTFAVGEGNDFMGTSGGYFLKDASLDDNGPNDDIWSGSWYVNWTFAWAFAATAATIVSGAVAERCTFNAYLVYSVVLTGFVYPVVVHWAWGGGAFSADVVGGLGVIDFAGSGVVHMTGGVAAVVGATILGPRKGRFDPQTGLPRDMPAQSTVFQVLGTFLLWVGWYGFNCVSTFNLIGESASATAAKVSVTTTLSAAFGGLGCALIGKLVEGNWNPSNICNGILGGLVGITAGCATVEPEGAVLIGIISAFVYYGAAQLLLKLKIDDVVNAGPVHWACGAWGTIAVGFFSSQNSTAVGWGVESCGVFYGCDQGGDQLAVQFAFVFAITAWVGAMSCIVFGAMKALGILRVPSEIEEMGLDESEHGSKSVELSKISVEHAMTNA
jgi:Amt family ammonium transporter